ncbi:MAG: DUF350 domain-containing protein [Bernardetiaceae bacterium]|nr:DUF350 domain-containing protein [Bernardetiaceae bacterium]
MMNNKLLFLATSQLLLALILALVVTFIAYKSFRLLLVKRYQIQEDNLAFAILSSSIIFAVGYIVSSALQPAITVLRILDPQIEGTIPLFVASTRYVVLFVSIAFVISAIVVGLGLFIFTQLTRKVEEFEEISKNNKAVGLITGVIIIVIALFVKDATVLFLEAFIPYPEMGIN